MGLKRLGMELNRLFFLKNLLDNGLMVVIAMHKRLARGLARLVSRCVGSGLLLSKKGW